MDKSTPFLTHGVHTIYTDVIVDQITCTMGAYSLVAVEWNVTYRTMNYFDRTTAGENWRHVQHLHAFVLSASAL